MFSLVGRKICLLELSLTRAGDHDGNVSDDDSDCTLLTMIVYLGGNIIILVTAEVFEVTLSP